MTEGVSWKLMLLKWMRSGWNCPMTCFRLPFCLKRVEDAEGVEQFFRPGVVEVHIGGGEVQGIADGVLFVVHAEIFDLVAPAGQLLANLEEVSLCTAAGGREIY